MIKVVIQEAEELLRGRLRTKSLRRLYYQVPDDFPEDKKRTYLSTKGPMYDEEGNVVGIIGISRDISERKEMEEDLRRSRDELEIRILERTDELAKTVVILKEQTELLDLAYDPMFFRDSDAIIRYWNSGAEKKHTGGRKKRQ